ncbi:Dabb family protein [Telluria mixta]|uniref:Dabb family protein n=1 Tax=Telluria mixta TaxID=34071 RepID=A0ABT2BSY0_9BURK|nr:Dabb family protein [Telluria mixta]MCS0628224.1 Dabb family protein [Telluria mixta]WEM93662.1 Dabb family protein [Telluria mixta]
MIKHIVMWKLKEGAEHATRAENALRVKEWLDACRHAVPGILRFDAVIAQDGLEATCDVMLYSEFASREALEAYNAHPLHQLLKTRMAPLRESRHSFDYEA